MPHKQQIESQEKSIRELTDSNRALRADMDKPLLKISEENMTLRAERDDIHRRHEEVLAKLREHGL